MTPAPEDMRPPLENDAWGMVGLDIDGTLMHWGGDISPAVIRAVEQVRMCRNHVILATGRNILGTLPVAETLGIRRGWAVCSNGAVTIRLNPATPGATTSSRPSPLTRVPHWSWCAGRCPMRSWPWRIWASASASARSSPWVSLVGRQRVVEDPEELAAGEATRVVIRAPGADVSHFDDLVHRIGLSDVTYAVGFDAWLDLTPPNVSKASALEHLRQQLGVYPDHTVAVGDGNNDIEMLRWAGRSAAMGTAPQQVRDAADEVVGSVQEDGILAVLERMIDPDRLAVL
ncbi:HAD family hydrolase [Demequina litorisediminis]|uniref:Haloacid dehalogenase n=2 Tax=Demequina TaxID=577469 RepID=A0ABQ6IE73_9MICO|nr:haloacid dehalogenase [Demequina litorisediminis]